MIGNLEGAFRYMKNYPYSCWEQKLGKGVAASNYLALKSYVSDDLSWPGADKTVKETLEAYFADRKTETFGLHCVDIE